MYVVCCMYASEWKTAWHKVINVVGVYTGGKVILDYTEREGL